MRSVCNGGEGKISLQPKNECNEERERGSITQNIIMLEEKWPHKIMTLGNILKDITISFMFS